MTAQENLRKSWNLIVWTWHTMFCHAYHVLHHPAPLSYLIFIIYMSANSLLACIMGIIFTFFEQEKSSTKQARVQDNGATGLVLTPTLCFTHTKNTKKIASVLPAISLKLQGRFLLSSLVWDLRLTTIIFIFYWESRFSACSWKYSK